jgi:RHS repeat-associated protein
MKGRRKAFVGLPRDQALASHLALHRLTNETISVSAPTGSLGYWYDSVGNRTNRTGVLGSLNAGSSIFNSNDELATDLYDANGNTTKSAGNAYVYDFENRLTRFNNRDAVITYDGDGNRASEQVGETTTFYLVDTHNPSGYPQVLEELQSVNQGPTNLSRAYTYGLSLISQRQPGVSTNFFVYDGHGSTRLLTDMSGNVLNAFAYDAFGNMIASSGPSPTPYLYCGQQVDPNFGLYYLRARYMNAATGRFWTRDTYEGDREDPLSLHKYLYAEDDPVDGSDPTGTDDLDSMSMAVYSAVFRDTLNIIQPLGLSATMAPYPVVVVTLPNGTQYTPETKVKDADQAGILGLPRYTLIRIPVPVDVNPQGLVDMWANARLSDNIVSFLYFWHQGGPHDYKDPKNGRRNSAIYDAFGNFEFGATGCAAGFDLSTLEFAGEVAHPSGGWRPPHLQFQNDPINEADIGSGYNAIASGGKLSVEEESLKP